MFTFTHRNPEMQLDRSHTALVLADIQNEFPQPGEQPRYHALIEDALKKRNVIANLKALLKTAQDHGYFIIHSPRLGVPTVWATTADSISALIFVLRSPRRK